MNKTMKIHPAAKAFPTLPGKEYNELVEDIKARGIRMPLLVNKKRDTILDGRTRWMIAHDLKLRDKDIPLEVFKGKDEEAVKEIISRNLLRRHLSDEQRVVVVAELLGDTLEKQAAADRKSGQFGKGNGQPTKGGETADRLAEAAKTTQHKARQALDVKRHASELIEDVKSGKTTLRKAAKVAKSRKPSKARPKKEKTLKEIVEAKWQRFVDSFPVQQHREVKKIVRDLL